MIFRLHEVTQAKILRLKSSVYKNFYHPYRMYFIIGEWRELYVLEF